MKTIFKFKVASALTISFAADALDYFAAPVFGTPVLGDFFDAIITGLLFSITRSKRSAAINMLAFIPVIGDLIPIYTLSTILWISEEYKKSQRKPNAQEIKLAVIPRN